ncbi:glutamate--tRNA ligase [Kitasatospora sp. NPDC127059]|uniref:glutamate--tRNA ligase n=1 Tax=unclassified Kitasatospora TaxID=2633591 RepID=UPI0036534DF9
MLDRALADSWFPSGLPEVQEWEERYPERDLAPGAEVTRFAPSPTGSLHLGGLYVALLSRELARQTFGTYLVRVEDTDTGREVAGAAEAFAEAFRYFDLVPDELEGSGAWGPYRQSEREDVYLSYVRELVRQGQAYPCFCSAEELAANTAGQQQSRSPLGYYGKWARCRGLGAEEADRRIRAGEPFTVRFRCPVGIPGRVRFQDRLRGSLTMLDNGNDVVILKSPQQGRSLPTYHFAHVVDDHLMRVTLVVRGEEWISSLPLHHQLHKALGFKPPRYAHIAPLMKVEGSSRRKLSKRKDPEAGVAYYMAAGYPAAAVRHYLRGLANNRLADLPVDKAAQQALALDEAGLSGAMVDLAKLRSVSRDHIASLPSEQALELLESWACEYDPELAGQLRANRVLALGALELAGAGGGRKDLACWSEFRAKFGFAFPGLHTPVTRVDDERFAPLRPDCVADLADALLREYRHAGPDEQWLDRLRSVATDYGFATDSRSYRAAPQDFRGSLKEVANVLRVCLTGSRNSPDLFRVAQLLGEGEVLSRLQGLRSGAAVPELV